MQGTNYLEAIFLFAKEKQRKHSSDPLIQTNIVTQKKYFFWFLSSLPLFQTPCNVRRKFHFSPKGHGTGGSGEEQEVKISFHRVNSEIWSVSHPRLGERLLSLATLPILFKYTRFSAFYHLFQYPGPWRCEYHLFSL